MVETARPVLLSVAELPPWFTYPGPFMRVVESGIIKLDPWWIFDQNYAREKLEGLRNRYPTRDLVPFARNQGNDDVACWEKGDLQKVVIIHDYAAPGWEQRATFDTFWDWFRAVVEDFIQFEP
jgi:hypothetical protein